MEGILHNLTAWWRPFHILLIACLFTSVVYADYPIKESEIDKGYWHQQVLVYPEPDLIDTPRPIVVISHGNGHHYTYYSYLQKHLAQKGFITMSHTNNTGPGIETASTTTLENTDILIGELDRLEDGVLKGKYDADRIAWIGHSRGAEGVVRAYTRLRNKEFVPENYSAEDINLISSIAPTTFLKAIEVNPEDVNYHMFVGAADGDVSGQPRPVYMSMPIYERSRGNRQLTYVHGAGHNVFNDQSHDEGQGPDRLSRDTVHLISKSYYEILLKIYLLGRNDLLPMISEHNLVKRPEQIPEHVVISNEYRVSRSARKLTVIDDFQSESDINVASGGAEVKHNLTEFSESILQDSDSSFSMSNDPFNGLTRYIDQTDPPVGAVFQWQGDEFSLSYRLPSPMDLSDFSHLSMRAAQISRDRLNFVEKQDSAFMVEIIDRNGTSAKIASRDFGVVNLPYQRDSGWASEFNTLRFPLGRFVETNPKIDRGQIDRIRFLFGSRFGSQAGRIAVDDIEVL